MRRLMWFSIGFAAGCLPVAYFAWSPLLLFVGLFCLLIALALFFVNADPARYVAVVLLGVFAASLWSWGYDGIYLKPAREQDGKIISATVTVSDYSYDTDYGMAADGRLKLEGRSYHVRVYLDKMEPLRPGDTVTGEFKLRLTTAGGQKDPTYHQGKGIFLLAYAQEDVQANYAQKVPFRFFPAKLRHDIQSVLDATFPEDTLGFVRALLLGDSTKLSYEDDTAFRVSGIRHVIAVSGLHVSILFALVYTLAGKQRYLTAIIGIPVLLFFAAIAGFTPSIVRACVMQSLMILAMLFKREYDPPTALSFAALTILVINPMAISSVSFQLSVGCMIGIFLFSQRITDYLLGVLRCPKGMNLRSRLTRWLAGGVGVTLSAMAVTTPLTILYFGSVSLIGVLTNLVCLWVISFIFYGIMLSCLLGAVWLPLGTVAAWVVSWPARFVLWIARLFSAVPLASVYTCSVYILLWVIFCYLLIAVFWLANKRKVLLFALSFILSFVLSVTAAFVEPRLDNLRVTVFDVGQGQSILIQSEGAYYLVDCGGDNDEEAADTVAEKLLSQGITRLDGLILTHYDADHAGGAVLLLSRIPADRLYLPDMPDDGDAKALLTERYAQKIQWITKTTSYSGSWGEMTLIAGDSGEEENESGLCILFQAQNCDILITGDRSKAGERALIRQIDLPKVELLVVGHHGSPSSTSFELLSVVQPSCAVISVGKDNHYGHPSKDVLDILSMFGCEVRRTDLEGTIVFKG